MNTSDLIPEILTFFDLGTSTEIQVAGGHANANFFVTTEKGSFVVKIIRENRTREFFVAEEHYIERASHHIPAFPYVENTAGEYLFEKDGVFALVQKRIDGSPATQTPEILSQIGEILAKLHTADTAHLPEKSNYLKQSYLEGELNVLKKNYPDHPDTVKFLEFWKSLQPFWTETIPHLPKGLVHGDANLGNILVHDGNISAVIDWEESGVDPLLFDFLITVMHACYKNDTFQEDLYRALYTGYTRIRTFTDVEEAAMVEGMRYVQFLEMIWRFLMHKHYHPEPENADRYKMLWGPNGIEPWKKPSITLEN